MPSTYTTDLAIQLMATGENAGTWGQITNTNLVIIEQAIAQYQSISIAGGAQTTALLMTQNAVSTARNAVLKLTGAITGNQIVTVPNSIEKTWIVSNGTTGAFTVTFKYASTGTGITWSTTDKGIKILYADGTDIQLVDLTSLSGTIATASITDSAVGATQINQSTITQANLASASVGANQIVQSTITQSKLATNSVGANQLQSTAVTPNTYTLATITVDADGRITSASSGSAGAGMEIPTLATAGPASGTYTASPTANRIGVYMYAGGGGNGGNGANMEGGFDPGGTGGVGGFGFYNKPITQPFSQPYSIGAAGNPGSGKPNNYQGNPGNAGGATNIANVGTVNAGNGGNGSNGLGSPGNPGNAGTQPGASLAFGWRQFIQGTDYGATGNAGALVVFENTGT